MVKIWNVGVHELDDQHLLGEHFELHVIWSALVNGRRGWRNHPEPKRWEGRLAALYARHDAQVEEMQRRGWRGHRSDLDAAAIEGSSAEWPSVDPSVLEAERERLRLYAWERERAGPSRKT
jgi:hypothetical protein